MVHVMNVEQCCCLHPLLAFVLLLRHKLGLRPFQTKLKLTGNANKIVSFNDNRDNVPFLPSLPAALCCIYGI